MKKGEKKQGRKAARRAKGTGTIQKHGRTYRATWVVDGVRFTRSTGTADRREAEKRLAEFVAPYYLKKESVKDIRAAKKAEEVGMDATADALVQSAKGKRAEAGRISVPLSGAWEAFNSSLARKSVSKEVNRIYESRWGVFEEWMGKTHPGVVGLAEVSSEMAEEFMQGIKQKRSAKTFNDYRVLLSQIWKVLDKAAGLDGVNPWREIAALEKNTHQRRELTAEELMRVVATLEGEMRTLFAIGIYTGLRMGDAVNLSWGAVDLLRGFIQWTPHKTAKHGTVVRIPLFPALAAILAETPEQSRRGLVLPGLAAEYREHNQYTSERIRRAFEAAGIETQGETGRKNLKTKTMRKAVEVGFHSLRHTFVSLCANAGVPLHIVQAIVGHTNAAMTAHYFHVSDEALRGAVAVLPDVFKAPAALPAHKAGGVVEIEDAGTAEAYEAVPASVAKVARMLAACSPAEVAEVERIVAGMLAGKESVG